MPPHSPGSREGAAAFFVFNSWPPGGVCGLQRRFARAVRYTLPSYRYRFYRFSFRRFYPTNSERTRHDAGRNRYFIALNQFDYYKSKNKSISTPVHTYKSAIYYLITHLHGTICIPQ